MVEPSDALAQPYTMAGVGVFAADTDAQARRNFTSQQQSFINLRRGMPGQVPPPIDDIDAYWSPAEKAMVEHSLAVSFVGSVDTVWRAYEDLPSDAQLRADLAAALGGEAEPIVSVDLATKKVTVFVGSKNG